MRTAAIAKRAAHERSRSADQTLYIETSALLAALLEQDAAAQDALRRFEHRVTSALTFAEVQRGVIRARVAGRLTAEQEQLAVRALRTFDSGCARVAVTADVLSRAGRPFPKEPVRTLDAIHLATMELIGDAPQLMTVLTRDVRIRDNAEAFGHPTE